MRIVSQSNPDAEVSDLEYMNQHPEIDFVIEGNYGGKFDNETLEKFNSIGSVANFPIFFFVKTGSKVKIDHLEDLRGKKIIFWSTPEGKDNFKDDQTPSPFSSDTLIKNIFKELDITYKNTKIINPYPNAATMDMDWDVLITNQLPDVDDESIQLSKEFKSGKISFLEFADIYGIQKKMPILKVQTITQSSYDPSKNIPKQNINYLTTTNSIIVKKDLDRNLIFALTDAAKESFSESSFLNEKNEFPSLSRSQSFEPNEYAEEYYKEGKPILYKYFPQNIASFLTKLLIIFIPLVTIILPIYEFFPKLYEWYAKEKITHWYHFLDKIEKQFRSADIEGVKNFLIEIEELDVKISNLHFPILHKDFVQQIYILREHLQLVKTKLESKLNNFKS